MLEIKHITKMYDDTHGIKDITLTIPKGCIYGLIGANGAGKSTLLKCVVGILQADNIRTNVTAPNGHAVLVHRKG